MDKGENHPHFTASMKIAFVLSISLAQISIGKATHANEYAISRKVFEQEFQKRYWLTGRHVDANRDRRISIHEIRHWCATKLDNRDTSRTNRIMGALLDANSRMDANRDGALSKGELLNYLTLCAESTKPSQNPDMGVSGPILENTLQPTETLEHSE